MRRRCIEASSVGWVSFHIRRPEAEVPFVPETSSAGRIADELVLRLLDPVAPEHLADDLSRIVVRRRS
jgi:hypothetical protein